MEGADDGGRLLAEVAARAAQELDEDEHLLAFEPPAVDAHRRRAAHEGQTVDRLLDLARRQGETAEVDDLLAATDDVEVAVGVEVAEVAGREPALRVLSHPDPPDPLPL